MKQTVKAKVIWFDKRDGEAMIRGLNGEGTAVLYACNIPGKKTLYPETACVYYNEGDVIDIYVEHGLVVSTTPARFDADKWKSLDHDRLAFRCDDNGKAINGLFGKGA